MKKEFDFDTLRWDNIKGWGDIEKEYFCKLEGYAITENNLDKFIRIKIKEVAQALGVEYEEMEAQVKKENEGFYEWKKEFFINYGGMRTFSEDYSHMKKLFRLPIIKVSKQKDKVKYAVMAYNNLSDTEKLEFFKSIGKISIDIKPIDDEETFKNIIVK